ncbi:hypothetical protein [Azospirillum picis]|uniref:Uncharacterized protein n=1 Tax=Azospirillum picis TaxID=488438 RepID=A0ABU0MSP0_9PROT|nr:hypothetical protein [Azospirillum picis]MBP2302550.1 hypothetical protein [Azospirillum picis]MDQ0536208.1 hypothetical protein [Azospirillum picis]
MANLLAQAARLASFQARVTAIESLFVAGRIGPALRRDLLIKARDLTEIPKITALSREKPVGSTRLAQMTEEEYREHRAAQRLRREQRRASSQGGEAAIHG